MAVYVMKGGVWVPIAAPGPSSSLYPGTVVYPSSTLYPKG